MHFNICMENNHEQTGMSQRGERVKYQVII